MLTAKGFVCVFFCCSESFFVVLRCFVLRCCFPLCFIGFVLGCTAVGCYFVVWICSSGFYVGYIISSSGSLFELYSVASSSSSVVAFC